MNALEKRHEGTGLWLIDSHAFLDWRNRSNSFLWLHGIPGSGKTVLSSTIVEHLRSGTSQARLSLYFYFDFNDKKKQTLENMLRSLVSQLYLECPDSRGPLHQLRESPQHLSKSSLKGVLLAMLSRVNDISIVLDALDESTTRRDLLDWLRDVSETGSCRVLVTARREQDIESALQCWMRPEDSMNIQEGGVSGDIRAYVSHAVRSSEELHRWHKMPEVQDEIELEWWKERTGCKSDPLLFTLGTMCLEY